MPQPKTTGNLAGSQIKKARMGKKLDQVELAAILDTEYGIPMTQKIVSEIEIGRRSVRDKELWAIAKALGTTPHELLDWK